MKIGFHTLGCKVNQYETEAMKEQFKKLGNTIVDESDFADVYIVNTCTVTHLADRKSRQYIRKMKRVNPAAIVAVTGCYAQVNPDEVSSIEGVDIVAGTNEKQNLPNYIEEYLQDNLNGIHVLPYKELNTYEDSGIVTSMESRTRAFIKIQEGCNRFCSYCIIPYARGQVRSRPLEDVVKEAETLVKQGFKEIILTGINTALYGSDLGLGGIEPLIRRLSEIDGEFRIRLSSLEPTVINKEYVKSLLNYPKLCHHLHLSVQSGSNKIIKSMNRRYTREEYLEITKVLREKDRCYGITTDIIVGFPGEEEEDFLESLDIVSKSKYGKVHVFKYSKRRDTPAAEFDNQVKDEDKNRRSSILSDHGEEVAKEFFRENIGTERVVLFEEIQGEYISGYTDNYIKVYVDSDENLVNQFAKVKLEELYKDGMKGVISNE